MTTGFRFAYGHIGAAALTEAYDLDAWPIQSDQDTAREWMRPDNESDIIERVAELVDGLTHKRGGYGKPSFKWKLRILSPMMTEYVNQSVFLGQWSIPATVRTFDRSKGRWVFFHATAQLSKYEDATPAAGGYDLYTITFVNCDYLPGAFSSGFSRGFE